MQKWRLLFFPVISLIILAPLLLPLLEPGTLHEFDMILHAERIAAFYRALEEHIIPPTWSTYLSYGFGSPVLIYNWSFPYYVASLALKFGSTMITAYKFATLVSYLGAFVGMYIFLKALLPDLSALVGAAWYVWAPYRFNINELRGAIGEEFAFVFWPLVFWATHLFFQKKSVLGFFTGAIFWAGLIWSHTPLFGMILPLWILFTAIELLIYKNVRAALLSAATFIFGLGLIAYSWIPIVVERNLLGYNAHNYIYPDNFVRWTQLLAQPKFIELGENFGPSFYSLGWPVIIVAALTAIILFSRLADKFTRVNLFQLLFLVVGIFAVFLMRPESSFVWKLTPMLAPTIVFPQRFLALTVFCGSILAALFTFTFKTQKRFLVALFFIALIMIIDFPYITLNPVRETNLAAFNTPAMTTTSVWGEFSPKWIPADFEQNNAIYAKQPLIEISPPTLTLPLCRQTSISISCFINTKVPSVIRLRQFYFPGWTGKYDNHVIPVNLRQDGAIEVDLPQPASILSLTYAGTNLENLAKLVSVLFAALYIYLFFIKLYTSLKRTLNPHIVKVVHSHLGYHGTR